METYTHSGNTRFILATEKQRLTAMRRARKWARQENQRAFKDNIVASSAIVEFLLNEKGLTMYEMNATYPKVKS